jgi:actin-related protein
VSEDFNREMFKALTGN